MQKNPNIDPISPIWAVRHPGADGRPRSVWGDETRKGWNRPKNSKKKTLRNHR